MLGFQRWGRRCLCLDIGWSGLYASINLWCQLCTRPCGTTSVRAWFQHSLLSWLGDLSLLIYKIECLVIPQIERIPLGVASVGQRRSTRWDVKKQTLRVGMGVHPRDHSQTRTDSLSFSFRSATGSALARRSSPRSTCCAEESSSCSKSGPRWS